MNTPLKLLLTATLLLCAVACDDSEPAGGDVISTADTAVDTTPPPSCSASEPCADSTTVCDISTQTCIPRCTESSCGNTALCDSTTGLCVEAQTCASTAECTTEGDVCDTCRGLCIPNTFDKRACEEDLNCFSDSYCDPCTGLCELRKPPCETCSFHYECGQEGDRCIDLVSAGGRFCSQACQIFTDCPEGYDCVEITAGEPSQCVPASESCDAPAACATDEDCRGTNTICTRGRCVSGCTPGACPSGKLCELGNCVDRCDNPARTEPCPNGTTCNTDNGLCEFPGQCRSSKDCNEPETYCDFDDLTCKPGCLVDDDCLDAAKECVDMACVPRGCKGNYACAFQQVCELSTATCLDAEGPYCESCDPNAAGACGPEANKCLEFEDQDGNTIGPFCYIACDADPDNACPQGYSCEDFGDEGMLCYRDCTFDPFGG